MASTTIGINLPIELLHCTANIEVEDKKPNDNLYYLYIEGQLIDFDYMHNYE